VKEAREMSEKCIEDNIWENCEKCDSVLEHWKVLTCCGCELKREEKIKELEALIEEQMEMIKKLQRGKGV
jgi:hypothetical protein